MTTLGLLIYSQLLFDGSATLDLDPAWWWYVLTAAFDLLTVWVIGTTNETDEFTRGLRPFRGDQ